MRMNSYRDSLHDNVLQGMRAEKEAQTSHSKEQWAILDCQPCQMDLWDQGKVWTDRFSPPQSPGPDHGGMTLPLPCFPWLAWSLFLFSLVTGLDLLTGNTIPCPHKHSSCVVLRQNILAERSPNTARLSGILIASRISDGLNWHRAPSVPSAPSVF